MRKTTAASFNESTNRVVWTETLKQGRQVLKRWMAAGEDGVNTTATDTRMIAMSVLMRAGFGQEYDFGESPQDKPDSPGGMDYREAIHMILTNAILLAGIGPDNLSKLRFLSKKIATLADAVVIFKRFMIETLDQGHKGQYAEDRGNLLANLVRALHEDKQLNESEVFGNTFVYIFGGHDTTAHSLAFTFVLLSIYPEVQEWMREELRQVLKDEDPQTWTYDCHTKLKRTLAVQVSWTNDGYMLDNRSADLLAFCSPVRDIEAFQPAFGNFERSPPWASGPSQLRRRKDRRHRTRRNANDREH